MNDESVVHIAMSRDMAYEFLQQLAQDDELRARIEERPGPELADRGIEIAPQLLPEQARLASKEEMEELLLLLGDDPTDKFGRPMGEAWPFHLLCFIFRFGALPFAQREASGDAAP